MHRARQNSKRTAAGSLKALLALASAALLPLATAQGSGTRAQLHGDPAEPLGSGEYRRHLQHPQRTLMARVSSASTSPVLNPDGTITGRESPTPTPMVPNGAFQHPAASPSARFPPSLDHHDRQRLTTRCSPPQGATTQINVIGTLADGTAAELQRRPRHHLPGRRTPRIATISSTGQLTAVGAGLVTVTARNDGLVSHHHRQHQRPHRHRRRRHARRLGDRARPEPLRPN